MEKCEESTKNRVSGRVNLAGRESSRSRVAHLVCMSDKVSPFWISGTYYVQICILIDLSNELGEEICQLFLRTVGLGRIFIIYRKHVRKPNIEVAQIRLEIRYSNRPLLEQEDDIEITLLPKTVIQKYLVP
jgi:hypothetical protein